MAIIKEHYRDFIGTIATRMEELSKELESMDFTEESWLEYGMINMEYEALKRTHNYLSDSERWAEFENLELLKSYVQTIESTYKSIDMYVESVLPIEGGDLVGITYEEWNCIESTRYELIKKLEAWHLFVHFCETGRI